MRIALSSNVVFNKLIKVYIEDFLLESVKRIVAFRDMIMVENTLIVDMTV